MKDLSQPDELEYPETRTTASGPLPLCSTGLVIPQPGEIWIHEHWGRVKIIGRWGDTESKCEVERRSALPAHMRRAILQNCLMRKEGAEV
jgi:hypothetical protein